MPISASPAGKEARPAAQDAQPSGKTNGTSVRRPFIVSTTAMADVTAQMLNTRVVLPSPSLGTAHSGYSSPLRPQVERILHGDDLPEPERGPVDPNDEPMFLTSAEEQGTVHEFDLESSEELEAEEWLERNVAEHEAHMPPPSNGAQSTALNLSSEPSATERGDESREEQAVERNSFTSFDDDIPDMPTAENSVSGPSFLGLNTTPDYLLEEPVSHTRRNLLTLVLVIFAVLGFMEWRASSRGESTNPADVLHLKMPKKKGQGEVAVVQPAGNAPAGPDSPSRANNGKPDLIAEPNQSATQKSAPTESQPIAAAAPSVTPVATTATPVPSKAETAQAPVPAMASPAPVQVAKATAPPIAKPSATVPQTDASVPATKPSPAKVTADDTTSTASDPSLGAGGTELQKGIAAGATEMGRMWLWKALGKGNGEAPVLLADMYAQGKGVPKDCEQAMLLLNAAAKKANPHARSKLGSMYAAGECVPQDRVQAYKWMSSALQANPGSDYIEKSRESLLKSMTAAERQKATVYR